MKSVHGKSHMPRSFLKWAGGKRQLLHVLEDRMPNSFETYYEPFLGSAAMMFHLLKLLPHIRCNVSDYNSELVCTYVTIRDNVDAVISVLKDHEREYHKKPEAYFYHVRQTLPDNDVQRTSRMIFLNRTCFNGLYRVNSRGLFNVPFGRYKNPHIVDEDNLHAVSRTLQSRDIQISCRSFLSIQDEISENDFVYFDPPYLPVSKTANFTSYTADSFGYDDLKSLVRLCIDLDEKGVNVMLSNSDSVRVSELFPDSWTKHKVAVTRVINSVANKRTGHSELVITNY